MNIIGIIPARSGSKGVPNKNLRLVGNISLLGKTILSAQKSKKLNEFFVSTDSREYIREAEKYNAKPPFLRPKELASDTAPTWQTLLHTVNEECPISLFFKCATSDRISVKAIGSTPANGSSKRIYFGFTAKHLAISTRRRSPPDNEIADACLIWEIENSASKASNSFLRSA